ncbi:VWA domain-containing protein [Brucella sp. NBRC 12950]|uniref:VWA domain-containing protein n=1 Tax=Brucella sp. NBRC 12950 TaxID=2994518 RepID=UPI00249FE8FC|nr:VWA domain-containing protein [Brucella sp. NBRC 12950]GLU29811.1 membrane protein [Brucella sp. NBRC 12950]
MYELDHPWLLLLLPVPLLFWWLLPSHRVSTASIRLPFFKDVARAAGVEPTVGSIIPRRSWWQIALDLLAWGFMVLALARPQLIEPPIFKTIPQRDILLALDLSQSMDTRDFATSSGTLDTRINAVKTVVADFASRRASDRLGLIAFGDAPYPLAPFTMDHDLIRTMIGSLAPGEAGPRTAMGDSIGLAIRMFEKSNVPEKVLILLSDGNDTASKMPPLKAAEIAKDDHIVVHTVAIGNPTATGEDMVDVQTLNAIAAQTDGSYSFGQDQTSLSAIYDMLDRITPQEQKELSWRPRRELFQYPAAVSFLILALSLCLSFVQARMARRASA